MRKQRPLNQAEKDFEANLVEFNKEAQKIIEDRSMPMSKRRRLISLKGKALLHRPAGAQGTAVR